MLAFITCRCYLCVQVTDQMCSKHENKTLSQICYWTEVEDIWTSPYFSQWIKAIDSPIALRGQKLAACLINGHLTTVYLTINRPTCFHFPSSQHGAQCLSSTWHCIPDQEQKLITEPRPARFLLRRKLEINTLRETVAMEEAADGACYDPLPARQSRRLCGKRACRDFQLVHLNTRRSLLPYRRGQMSSEEMMMEARLLSNLTSWEDRVSQTALPIDLHYWGVRTRCRTFISEQGSPATSLRARQMSEETSDCFRFRMF